jgi:hypothetical protein
VIKIVGVWVEDCQAPSAVLSGWLCVWRYLLDLPGFRTTSVVCFCCFASLIEAAIGAVPAHVLV